MLPSPLLQPCPASASHRLRLVLAPPPGQPQATSTAQPRTATSNRRLTSAASSPAAVAVYPLSLPILFSRWRHSSYLGSCFLLFLSFLNCCSRARVEMWD